jgi:predicted ATP-dependent serine protease
VLLTFQRAGDVALQVPVASPSENQGPPAGDHPPARPTAVQACEHRTAQWVGRCPSCRQTWGTLVEAAAASRRAPGIAAGAPATPARRIADVAGHRPGQPSGVSELDRVLGGGLVPGAVVLLAGEPGVGKSTLLLEVAAKAGTRVLYVTGEESAGQVRLRAERTGALRDELYIAAESDLGAILGHLDELQPDLLIIDSIQTMSTADADGAPGGVTQTRAVTVALTGLAKERGLPVLLVGHVTKEGGIAGPRVLEHLVDVVLSFEGDKHRRCDGARREEPLRGGLLRAARRDRRMPDPSGFSSPSSGDRRCRGRHSRHGRSAPAPPRCRPWCTAGHPPRGGR